MKGRSLQWHLVRRLILLQAATLFLFVVLLWTVAFLMEPRVVGDNELAANAIAAAADRDASGRLVVRETAELQALRGNFPNAWAIVRDARDETAVLGRVPDVYAGESVRVPMTLDHSWLYFAAVDLRPDAYVANRDSAAGRVQILVSTVQSREELGPQLRFDLSFDGARKPDGTFSWYAMGPVLAMILVAMLAPFFVVMGVTTLVATPLVVRRSLAGLVATANQARSIDIDNRGVQLPTAQVPSEVAPLVGAFNTALARLGEGYDRRNRFLTDAAHELRTPIAILRTRAELLRDDPESRSLLRDIERLSQLAQQLLDRQVLDYQTGLRETTNLVGFVGDITADFAPLAFRAGYDLSFEPAPMPVMVEIRPSQIRQAITNLLRNAIDHGGGRGTISVLVDATGGIEIRDEGPGIPEDEHERVFEPFYRLKPRSSGAGLGLNLAREIARLHGGRIDILKGTWRGARIRIQLPLVAA
jgi:signal transduction histidine kinase